jgi:membrane protein implicated in regulation of membrane protease activity
MSRLLEFFLGSILITVFTVALMFFSVLQYVLKVSSAAECTWQGSARTWVDSNRDGLVNLGEQPLHGVEIHVDDIGNGLVAFGDEGWPAVTDKDGDAQFNIPIPGCSDTMLEIYVDIPEGYRTTTIPRIEVDPDLWETLGSGRVYYFGFAPEQ